MLNFIKFFGRDLSKILSDSWSVLCGFVATILGFFLPIRDIVHLLILFFILDVIFGYWAARKTKGEKFSTKKIWESTVPRMLISIVLIAGAFMWDKVYHQDIFSTYKTIGWFLSGILLFSIAKNGYAITRWTVFRKIGNLFRDETKLFKKKPETQTNNETK